jgi:predicted nucleotidyltransferase
MSSPNVADLLFSSYRRQVLALLLLRSEEDFHVREISRLTGVPAGSLHRELKLLAEAGLLVRKPSGNQVRYRANRDCPVFEELASIFRKTAGLADIVREALAVLGDEVELAFIFGSVAQGKERVTSDVDVFIVGDVSFENVVRTLAGTDERLGRILNPVVMNRQVFSQKLESGDYFLRRVMDEPKIFILGGSNDFGKSIEDRTIKESYAGQK